MLTYPKYAPLSATSQRPKIVSSPPISFFGGIVSCFVNRSDELFLHCSSGRQNAHIGRLCCAFAPSFSTKIVSSPPIPSSWEVCVIKLIALCPLNRSDELFLHCSSGKQNAHIGRFYSIGRLSIASLNTRFDAPSI